MPVIKPLPEEKAPDDLKPIYENMKKRFGRMPNFFGMMAHKPEVLKTFLPFYSAATGPGASTTGTKNSLTSRHQSSTAASTEPRHIPLRRSGLALLTNKSTPSPFTTAANSSTKKTKWSYTLPTR